MNLKPYLSRVFQREWLLFLLFCFLPGYACTDFRIISKDGTVVIARSMEFATDLKSNIRSSTRGRIFKEIAPNGEPAMHWQAKYGYLFLDGFEQDFAIDGMNEHGLSYEALYLPLETRYQIVPLNKNQQSIPYTRLGDWILSNFKTIEEVRNALKNIYVYQQKLPGLGDSVFPLHASVFDASGKGLVIEFIGGDMQVYNHIGVMTNSPGYPWHVINLQNYLNLSPYNPHSVTVAGHTYVATGQGSGLVGLPGDPSPPSRFVKIAMLLNTAYPSNNAAEAVNLGEHIINNVDIPIGMARSITNGKEVSDYTQWVDFKDLTHKILYYRTYKNFALQAVDMNKINFSQNAIRLKIPLVKIQ
jgi:choloylglycine hydrolase